MNLTEALEKLSAVLPGAEKAKQLEGKITELEGNLAKAVEQVTALKGQLSAKDEEITKLKGEVTTAKAEVEAKEKDVEKRANAKAAEIAKARGLEKPVGDESNPGGSATESAFKTYARLVSEGKTAEAAKFYAENAEAIIKSRNEK